MAASSDRSRSPILGELSAFVDHVRQLRENWAKALSRYF